VTAETGGGDVRIAHASGAHIVTARKYRSRRHRRPRFPRKQAAAHVRLASATGAVKAETGAGDISAKKCSSSVKAETGGGKH